MYNCGFDTKFDRIPETRVYDRIPETIMYDRIPKTRVYDRIPETRLKSVWQNNRKKSFPSGTFIILNPLSHKVRWHFLAPNYNIRGHKKVFSVTITFLFTFSSLSHPCIPHCHILLLNEQLNVVTFSVSGVEPIKSLKRISLPINLSFWILEIGQVVWGCRTSGFFLMQEKCNRTGVVLNAEQVVFGWRTSGLGMQDKWFCDAGQVGFGMQDKEHLKSAIYLSRFNPDKI